MIEVTFNGVKLSEYIRVTEVIRPIGNNRELTLSENLSIGATVTKMRRGVKEHIIKFDIDTRDAREREELKHVLAGIFDVENPVKVTYSDEPDKYYLGIPSGDATIEKVTRWFNRSEIQLIIPDGVAHSTTYRPFNSPTVSSDRLTFNIVNNGNVDAFPIIRVKHKAENGYIGVVNERGAFELGNREEVDRETVKRSELLLDYRDNKITAGLTAGTQKVAILNDTSQALTGTVGSVNMWGRPHLYLANRGGTTGNNAGSLTWTIPADSSGSAGSLNDYIWWRQIFWLGATNQFGFIKLTVSDEQGQFLYGVETFKRANGLGCEYNFMASNGRGGYNMLKRWKFTGTHLNEHNPFNATGGASDLKRNDDKVVVHWWGSYSTFTIPEIKGKKSAKIHVAFGAIGNKPLVSHMYLDSLYYRKDHVSVSKDVPNRYPIGSEVEINFEDDKVWIDGKDSIGEVVDGSDLLVIPPGKSTMEVYFSSWVTTKPDVTIEFEERWL